MAKKPTKSQAVSTAKQIKMVVSVIMITLLLLYIIWPLDFIPDIIPIIGWVDDAIAFFLILVIVGDMVR